MLLLYCITSFALDPLMSFFRSHNPVTMTVICDVALTLVLSSKIKIKKKKIEIRKKLKTIRVYYL